MKGCSTSNLVGAVIPNRPCLISKTLHSSARFTETERRRATFSIVVFLALLLAAPCYAWDDEEFDSKPFHQSNFNQQSTANDYGYKNTTQANASRRTSVIHFGEPKRLSREDDDLSPKRLITPQQEFESSRVRSLHVDTIQEAAEKRSRQNKELMDSYQEQFKEQQARHERSWAQQAKQQAVYDEMNREECEMAEFLGGVYKAKFGAVTGRDSAVTSEGYIFRSGNNFVTPRGIYSKDGNVYAGPDGITTQTGDLFFGSKGTTIQAGGAFFTEGQSGFIVGPNCRNTSTWRSR